MQIACPQCSMQYVLDARLLPPSGASVQCTRCGHVFMASPTGVMAPAPKIPPAGGGDRTGAQSSTQIFGGEGASNLKSTNLFAGSTTASGSFVPQPTPASGALTSSGVIPPPPSIAPVAAQPPAVMGTTRAFGAVGPAGMGAPPPAAPPEQGAAPGATTRAFGAVSASSSGSFRLAEPGSSWRGPEGGGATRAFGAVSGPAPSGAADASIGATRAFGAVSGPSDSVSVSASPVSSAPRSFESISPSGDPADPPWSAAGGSRSKLVPEGNGDAPWATSSPTATVSLPGDDAPFARTEPSKPAVSPSGASVLGGGLDRPLPSRKPSGDLPPELLGASSRADAIVIEDGDRRSSGMSWVLLGLTVLAGIVLAGYLAYPVFRDRNSAMPVEAVAKKEEAVRALRRDDAPAREQAIQDLKVLATAHPKYAEVQAELAVAYTLQLGDLHAEFDRLNLQAAAIKREIDAVTTAKASPNWMGQANALHDDLRATERDMQPLRADIAERRNALDALMETLRAAPDVEPAATVAARLKAQALYAAVTGAPNALGLAERLRQVELPPSWSVLARAEYALSSGTPATVEAVSKELEALRAQDRYLFRAFVLGARLAIRQGDPDTARNLLDEVVALNPKHDLARRMLAQTAASEPSP
ncbi:tetratricopeptide repeat protein [Corallococcus sp. AB032C]|uniref:zinc-ribbon domain-containing protein n=1 Tax=Corallococcus TaxID=83461 RepID=UPI000EE50BEC|nr:zinc-ribbon domain-containing protein [Corallococcus sp. AB032C]NPC50908.1 tetratricopeptide repeat protein [Corallococcus exiguus]RKH83994.1 tetratricopeptide repeat protein [Corallococcus sp. AB032C]